MSRLARLPGDPLYELYMRWLLAQFDADMHAEANSPDRVEYATIAARRKADYETARRILEADKA